MSSAPEEIRTLLVTGYPGWLSNSFLDSLRREPLPGLRVVRLLVQRQAAIEAPPSSPNLRFETVIGDLTDPSSLETATRGTDAIMHAAGVIHVRRTRDWYDINTRGTAALVDATIASKCRRMVFISSNAAAGRSDRFDRLLSESDPPLPQSHYGRSKLLAEEFLMAQGARIEPVVLRPCMFYGPPVPSRHVEIYRRVARGRIPLVGGGGYARSVTYIGNLVDACRRALSRPEAVGQTYFIADRSTYTTRQIIEAMASSVGATPRFFPLPAAAAKIAWRLDTLLSSVGVYWQTLHLLGEADWHVGVSIRKACEELGFNPATELDQGMLTAVEWCRERGLLP